MEGLMRNMFALLQGNWHSEHVVNVLGSFGPFSTHRFSMTFAFSGKFEWSERSILSSRLITIFLQMLRYLRNLFRPLIARRHFHIIKEWQYIYSLFRSERWKSWYCNNFGPGLRARREKKKKFRLQEIVRVALFRRVSFRDLAHSKKITNWRDDHPLRWAWNALPVLPPWFFMR